MRKTQTKKSSSRWWDSAPIKVSAFDAKELQVVKRVPEASIFTALAALPGMRDLATKNPTQSKPKGDKMAVSIDQLTKKAIADAMAKMGFPAEEIGEIEPPHNESLLEALQQAHSLDVLCMLKIHGERQYLAQQGIQVFCIDGFNADLKAIVGFPSGSFATRLSTGEQVIVVDSDDVRYLSKALNLCFKSATQAIICHEYGHLLSSKAGYSATDEKLAWDLGEHFGQPLLNGSGHAFQAVKRHLLQQQVAA